MTLHPGDRLGTFEVVGNLGRGGMGEVYEATDTLLEGEDRGQLYTWCQRTVTVLGANGGLGERGVELRHKPAVEQLVGRLDRADATQPQRLDQAS